MYRQWLVATAAALILTGPALSQDTTTPAPTEPQASDQNQSPTDAMPTVSTPQEFATMAAMSDMFEIQSSQVALEKAQSEQVREFAQHMVDDHTQSSEALKQAAEAEGVTDIPQSLDAQHQEMLTQLQDTPEEQFDAQYMQMQVMAHQQAVALFDSYSEHEGELADFAETTLPTLQEHLSQAQEVSQQSQ